MRFDRLVSPAIQRRMLDVAREYRREQQPSEVLLWEALRGRRLLSFKFRRQQPVGSLVVDFYCDEVALVVEVDGPIHALQRHADGERQALVEAVGLRVLRVPAHDVESNLDDVISLIASTLTNAPLPRGEG